MLAVITQINDSHFILLNTPTTVIINHACACVNACGIVHLVNTMSLIRFDLQLKWDYGVMNAGATAAADGEKKN